MSVRIAARVILAGSLCAAACGQPSSSTPPADGRVQPAYDKSTGKLNELAYDRNGNGTMDTWGYMDGTRVIRVETDENEDGKIDRWEYHGEAAERGGELDAGIGTIERIERATRLDGRINRWEYFERGALVRIEEDSDADGKVDKWETYVNGALSSMTLDTQGSGRPDRKLLYRPDGSLDHIEADPDGTGEFRPINQ